MKNLAKLNVFKTFITLLVFNFMQLALWAQDAEPNSTTSTTKTTITTDTQWYSSPWVWVAGAAVFILLLVALLRGGGSSGSSDRVTVTKTVRRDTDADVV